MSVLKYERELSLRQMTPKQVSMCAAGMTLYGFPNVRNLITSSE